MAGRMDHQPAQRFCDFTNDRAAPVKDQRSRSEEYQMARRRGSRPSNRQILAIVAVILALLALTGFGGVPWLPIAVIVLALTHLI